MKTYLKHDAQFLDTGTKAILLDNYAAAGKRLILLDYDGTLIPLPPTLPARCPERHWLSWSS